MAKFEKYEVKTTSKLNVRQKGSLNAKIVNVLAKDEKVEIIGLSSNGKFGKIGTGQFICLNWTERV